MIFSVIDSTQTGQCDQNNQVFSDLISRNSLVIGKCLWFSGKHWWTVKRIISSNGNNCRAHQGGHWGCPWYWWGFYWQLHLQIVLQMVCLTLHCGKCGSLFQPVLWGPHCLWDGTFQIFSFILLLKTNIYFRLMILWMRWLSMLTVGCTLLLTFLQISRYSSFMAIIF